MKTRTQQIIEDVLGDHSRPTDNSLQAKAMRRALSGATPRTLTPWEWEEWYAAQGKQVGGEVSGETDTSS
ncbi:hypothetical protein R0135_09030 [Congregibacter variabilis]|uniref:Uncharacterized protein n=1 Tax=Congregibacter variabilis TaxID=3081200 RepID=A0ABZ0HXH8_9GAMM|nr:hypothetical protein R0135_09030 [Congregibacter sp. IMCC43200]